MTISTMLRHDLLNKLTVAQGGLELFDRSSDMKFLAMAKRNLEACGEIVGRISTLENAPGTTALKPIDVALIARNVMVNHQEQGIGLEVHGRGMVMADAALHNVFDNLVSNSIKHAVPTNIRHRYRRERRDDADQDHGRWGRNTQGGQGQAVPGRASNSARTPTPVWDCSS